MAKVREINVSVGVSIDKKGVWLKANTGITVTVEESDDLQACFKRAFEVVDNELSKQLEDYGIDMSDDSE